MANRSHVYIGCRLWDILRELRAEERDGEERSRGEHYQWSQTDLHSFNIEYMQSTNKQSQHTQHNQHTQQSDYDCTPVQGIVRYSDCLRLSCVAIPYNTVIWVQNNISNTERENIYSEKIDFLFW